MSHMNGKVAIVLGASKAGNMGQVIARRLRKEGAQVVVSGRNAEELERFAGEHDGVTAIPCDITRKADITRLAEQATSRLGPIRVAVNATGWAKGGRFTDYSEEDLASTLAIQFKGPFQFLQAMVAAMERGGGGSIVEISSATATIMTYDYAAYMGTKAGMDHVVRAVANEYGSKGIRVNSISPGLTDTPMTSAVFKMPGIVEAFRAGYPLGRIGTSDDIASAVVWLASEECFMTGENLQVNGGLCLRGNPSPELRQFYMERAKKPGA